MNSLCEPRSRSHQPTAAEASCISCSFSTRTMVSTRRQLLSQGSMNRHPETQTKADNEAAEHIPLCVKLLLCQEMDRILTTFRKYDKDWAASLLSYGGRYIVYACLELGSLGAPKPTTRWGWSWLCPTLAVAVRCPPPKTRLPKRVFPYGPYINLLQ